ncbi:MAG: InlB B-repeat-containing protein [Eubacterium sp.]|nr:InlB B-repeat-containing protein [Eubacterium sp.]
MYYSNDAVLLYDGVNPVILPVMLAGEINSNSTYYNKTRYIWSAYPSDGNGNDDPNWGFDGAWRSGNGADANWNWNWWSNTSTAGYNRATGFLGTWSTSMRSGKLQASRSGFISYTYYSTPLFMSNALKYNGTPAAYQDSYNLTWYFTTGGDNNNDVSQTATNAPIKILNYKTLTDAIMANGSKMKGIDLDDFSEGGLLEYVRAMDAATKFDPNTYFVNGNGLANCVSNMQAHINAMNNAPTDKKDYDGFANLRKAMDDKRGTYGDGSNNGYTDDSWANFANAWNAAKNFMASMTGSEYNDSTAQEAQRLADELNLRYTELVTNVEKANTEALEAVIDTFFDYANIFTDETFNAALEAINAAKTAVWGDPEFYKDQASGPDDTEDGRALVAAQVTAVQEAIRNLRISPDAYVTTPFGRFSLNSAIALLEQAGDPSDYSNYADFSSAVNEGTELTLKLPLEALTDYDKQYETYVDMIEKIVDAYYNLEYAFTRIPDGTLADVTTYGQISQLYHQPNSGNGYKIYGDFTYPTKGTIFKTTHNALTANYGDADFTYTLNNGGNSNKDNNSIDGITIAGTADQKVEIRGSGAFSSTVPTLNDGEKQTYAAGLSYKQFSLSNFRVTGKYNDAFTHFGITPEGTKIYEYVSPTDEFTRILGTVEGKGGDNLTGVIPLKPQQSGSNATITLTGDMNITVPATTAQTLSASTLPTSSIYQMNDTYFGMTYTWNTQPTSAYAGYGYMTSKENGEVLNSTVTVIDISYLIDLVNMCDALVAGDSQMYTTESMNNLKQRLQEAKANMDYIDLTADTITSRCRTRYNNLWIAYQELEIRKVPITFSYKGADGVGQTTVIRVEYGKTLNDYADQINKIVTPDYTSENGVYVYTFDKWDIDIDLETPVTFEITYTAVYKESLNKASFAEYNAALDALFAKLKLADRIYLADDLKNVQSVIDSLTYYSMPEAERTELMGDVQPLIDAETEIIVKLYENLKQYEFDESAIEATKGSAKAEKDSDIYDLSGIDFDYYENVVIEDITYIGLVMTQEEADALVREVLNNVTKIEYTIYLNGTPVGKAEYGTTVIVDSNGDFATDVEDPTVNNDACDTVAWTYSYAAPSRNNQKSIEKYMITAPSLGFIVKGDTYLTTVNATSTDEGYVVTFKTDSGKVFDVQYTTDGTVVMPDAPSYAFYTFAGYSNGAEPRATITVNGNTTITANYTADTSKTYTISFFDGYSAWDSVTPTTEVYPSYNELVEFTSNNAYCWASVLYDYGTDGYEFTLLAYGSSYSFYACRSYNNSEDEGLVALTEAQYQMILRGTDNGRPLVMYDGLGNEIKAENPDGFGYEWIYPEAVATVSVLENVVPIYDANGKFEKFSMIGTFTLPEGYTMIETGFLFSSNQSDDLTIENVGNRVARMKAERYTCGKQFVVNVKAPSSGAAVSFKYVGYAIVQDAEGELVTLYSKPISGTTEGF